MALEDVADRLRRITRALRESGVPYALVGGQAVAVWVATKDPAAVRTTKDVDILGEAFETKRGIKVAKLDPFPEWLSEAAGAIQRDFGLPENWLNTGPASQIDSGLPEVLL